MPWKPAALSDLERDAADGGPEIAPATGQQTNLYRKVGIPVARAHDPDR